MQITNKPGLSQCWLKAVEEEEVRHSGWRSMTELIAPPRIHLLRKRHWKEIVIDVTARTWSLMGRAVHYILEKCSSVEVMTEQRFEIELDGKKISFQPDRVEQLSTEESIPYWNGEKRAPFAVKPGMKLWRLKDFKITKVYAVKMASDKGKNEWIAQCNGYAWALFQLGFPVVEADIEAFMKDHDWLEANVKKTHDYPPYEIMCISVNLWPLEMVEQYLRERIAIHREAESCSDENLPFCTLVERWGTEDRYAVKKIGSVACLPKLGAFSSFDQAEAARVARKDSALCEVEFRRGESKRCERYCEAKPFCSQYMTHINPVF